MGISLTGTQYVDFGDLSAIAEATELTIAVCVKLTASPSTSEAILGQWGSTAAAQAFLLYVIDTNEIGFVVHDATGGANWRSCKTTALNIANGSTYWIIARWKQSTNTITINVNGATPAQAAINTDAISAIENSANVVRVGYDPSTGVDALDGDYAEVAIWTRYLTNVEASMYGTVKPDDTSIGSGSRVTYFKATDTSTLTDEWGTATVTNHSGTDATHPTLLSPGDTRVSQGPVEVVLDEDTAQAARVSQGAVEVVMTDNANPARVTQLVAELLLPSVVSSRVTQMVAELLTLTVVESRHTQLVVELLNAQRNPTRLTQFVIEVLGKTSTYCGPPSLSPAALCGKPDVLAWLEWTVPMREN